MTEHDAKDQVRKLLSMLQTSVTDPELRTLLTTLDADIHRALSDPPAPAASDGDLRARTREIAVRFAMKHPRLEPVLEELVNLLAAIGI